MGCSAPKGTGNIRLEACGTVRRPGTGAVQPTRLHGDRLHRSGRVSRSGRLGKVVGRQVGR